MAEQGQNGEQFWFARFVGKSEQFKTQCNKINLQPVGNETKKKHEFFIDLKYG